MPKQPDASGLYFEQLRLALNNFNDPQWLGENSPLAAPYFLGAALAVEGDMTTAVGRGQTLQTVIKQAADALWDGLLPQTREELETAVQTARQEQGNSGNLYYFFLLELRYFRRYFRPRARPAADSEQAIRDYLGVGRGPYFNHLKKARERLGEALSNLLQPTFRLEQPPLYFNKLIGRAQTMSQCRSALQTDKTVALTGMGGIGKTTVAATIAKQWGTSAVFWFTFRPTLNDQLNGLLFSLGYFLHQQGVSGLWLQLAADHGNVENLHVALEQLRGDLHTLQPKPLLCFDEIDHLVVDPDKMTIKQQQLRTFMESLRSLTPILLIGQQVVLLADEYVSLSGLSLSETTALLGQSGVDYIKAEAVRLHEYTQGNARMMWICVSLCQAEKSLTEVLDELPSTAVFQDLFTRLWQMLSPDERRFLQHLSVFRSPVPEDAFPQATAVRQQLAARHILQQDDAGGISLVPIIHDLIYEDRQRLPAAEMEQAHFQAATIRLERGEYTAAAFHFAKAGEPTLAIQVWYPYRQQEIKRGQAAAALEIFTQLSQRRLPQAEKEALALLQAELYQLVGEIDQGLRVLKGVKWPKTSETAVDASQLRGVFLNSLGFPHIALKELDEGLNMTARLLQQSISLRQQKLHINIQQWQIPEAMQEVRLSQYTTEYLQGLVDKYKGNYEASYIAFHKALAFARSADYATGMAQSNRELAGVLIRQANYDEAKLHLQAAIDYYTEVGDRLNLEKTHSTLLFLYFQAGNFKKVIEIGEPLLSYFERVKIPYYAGGTAANLAEAFYEVGDLPKAEFYAFKVLSFEETHPYPYALYTLSLVSRAQKRFERAEQYLQQSHQVSAENGDKFMEAYALRLWGEVLADQQKEGEAVTKVEKALQLFRQLEIQSEIETTEAILQKLTG